MEDYSGRLLLAWVKSSLNSQLFVLDNLGLFSFNLIFPERSDFDEFISVVSSNESLAAEKLRLLLNIQRQYLTANTVDGAVPSGSGVSTLKLANAVEDAVASSSSVSTKLEDEDTKPEICCDERIVHLKLLNKSVSISDIVHIMCQVPQGRIYIIKVNKVKLIAIVGFDTKEAASIVREHLPFSEYASLIKVSECGLHRVREAGCQVLRVGNLVFYISHQGLYDYLRDCGISSIKKVRNTDYALADFLCPEFAKTVLMKFLKSPDEALYNGMALDFQPFTSYWTMHMVDELKKSSGPDYNVTWLGVPFPFHAIHIFGIHESTSRTYLYSSFQQFGDIEELKIYQKSQVAFISFSESNSTRKAIIYYRQSKLVIKGQQAYVELCCELPNNDEKPSIHVSNFPVGTNEYDILTIFSKLSFVFNVGFGLDSNEIILVLFDCACVRDAVLSYCHRNRSTFEIGGHSLTIRSGLNIYKDYYYTNY